MVLLLSRGAFQRLQGVSRRERGRIPAFTAPPRRPHLRGARSRDSRGAAETQRSGLTVAEIRYYAFGI